MVLDRTSVYDQRGDLPYAFSNAFTVQANYTELLSWAGQVVTHVYADGDSGLLASFGYYYDLAYVYNSRGDLQAAFPNALTNGAEWAALVTWAQNVVNHKFPDSSYATLLPYAAEYNAL